MPFLAINMDRENVMKLRFWSVMAIAFISVLVGPAVQAQDVPRSGASANYRDLSQSPGGYVATTPAEHRAKMVADIIVRNWLSFRIGLALPEDADKRNSFVSDLTGNANADAVKAYVGQVAAAEKMARTLIGKGTTVATDQEVADFAAAADKMRAAEIKVSYDNPQPDGAELNIEKLRPVLDTKGKHVISDLVKLGEGGGMKLNDAPAGDFASVQDEVAKSRLHELTSKAGVTGREQTQLEAKLAPLVAQEVNGSLWQYREIISLIVTGMDQPDQGAMDIFNAVLDELHANGIAERHLL